MLDAYGQKCLEGWKAWAASSFKKGAGQAHRYTRAKAAQEIYDWGNLHNDLAQPHVLADKSMRFWGSIWGLHEQQVVALPAGASSWAALPDITVAMLRAAALSFPWHTGVGQFQFSPRSLWYVSDVGLYVLGRLFSACERLHQWPQERAVTQMVRLPKESGGSVVIRESLLRIAWFRTSRS